MSIDRKYKQRREQRYLQYPETGQEEGQYNKSPIYCYCYEEGQGNNECPKNTQGKQEESKREENARCIQCLETGKIKHQCKRAPICFY